MVSTSSVMPAYYCAQLTPSLFFFFLFFLGFSFSFTFFGAFFSVHLLITKHTTKAPLVVGGTKLNYFNINQQESRLLFGVLRLKSQRITQQVKRN